MGGGDFQIIGMGRGVVFFKRDGEGGCDIWGGVIIFSGGGVVVIKEIPYTLVRANLEKKFPCKKNYKGILL